MFKLLFPLVYERYLAKQIYLSFGFILFALISIFLFFDVLAEIRNATNTYTSLLIFAVIGLKIPSRMVEIAPVAALISGIYTCATLASSSEFTIFRVAGLQPKAALGTLLKIAIPIAIATLITSEYIGPICETISRNIRVDALNDGQEKLELRSGAWMKDKRFDDRGKVISGIRYINVEKFNTASEFSRIRVYEFDQSQKMVASIKADSASFDESGRLFLKGINQTDFSEITGASPLDSNIASQNSQISEKTIFTTVNRNLLSALLIQPDRMSIWSLGNYIRHLAENKQNYQRYAVAFWKKVIYPFTVLVMMALALPFAYMQSRSGGIGYKVFGGILLGISFQLFNSLFSHLGILGDWPAAISGLVPAALYFLLALGGLKWASK